MVDKFVSQHRPTQDASRLNRAVEKAGGDASFIDASVAALRGLRFPAFKDSIVDYARQSGAPEDTVALFDSLNGYIEYRDLYHLQKSLEENNAGKKQSNQMTDETRTRPDFRTRPTDTERGIKERKAANENEQRKDYPEVTPTAMSDYICDKCGKPFQNQQDMLKHQQFESGTSVI